MASPILRVISDQLSGADGRPAAGWIEIGWKAGVSIEGRTLAAGQLRIQVSAGKFTVSLVPYRYAVTYRLSTGNSAEEIWEVPEGQGTLRIAQVRS